MRLVAARLTYRIPSVEVLAALIAMILAAFAPAAWAQTDVLSDIREDATWTPEGAPYYVARNITVSDGATLTIAPGTVVEFGFDDTIFVYDGARITADSAVFRPRSTAGFEPAIYTYETAGAGNAHITNSVFEHLIVQSSGSGELVLQGNRFEGEAHVRIYSTRAVTIRDNVFANPRPIWTEIGLPASTVEGNAFAPESVLYLRHAQRVTRDDSLRTYQALPVHVNNDVTVTDGAVLVIPEDTHVLQGHFHSFHVNGGAELRVDRARFSPAGRDSGGPSIIVSTGNGAGRATIDGATFEAMYVEFAGGSGTITQTNFLVDVGRTALRNTGTGVVDARHNYWNGADGPSHSGNPDGDGAAIGGNVEFAPWLTAPAAQTATFAARRPADLPATFEIAALYPNPAVDRIQVRVSAESAGEASYALFDMLGRLISRGDLGAVAPGVHEWSVDTSRLANGAYAIRIHSGARMAVRRFTVRR